MVKIFEIKNKSKSSSIVYDFDEIFNEYKDKSLPFNNKPVEDKKAITAIDAIAQSYTTDPTTAPNNGAIKGGLYKLNLDAAKLTILEASHLAAFNSSADKEMIAFIEATAKYFHDTHKDNVLKKIKKFLKKLKVKTFDTKDVKFYIEQAYKDTMYVYCRKIFDLRFPPQNKKQTDGSSTTTSQFKDKFHQNVLYAIDDKMPSLSSKIFDTTVELDVKEQNKNIKPTIYSKDTTSTIEEGELMKAHHINNRLDEAYKHTNVTSTKSHDEKNNLTDYCNKCPSIASFNILKHKNTFDIDNREHKTKILYYKILQKAAKKIINLEKLGLPLPASLVASIESLKEATKTPPNAEIVSVFPDDKNIENILKEIEDTKLSDELKNIQKETMSLLKRIEFDDSRSQEIIEEIDKEKEEVFKNLITDVKGDVAKRASTINDILKKCIQATDELIFDTQDITEHDVTAFNLKCQKLKKTLEIESSSILEKSQINAIREFFSLIKEEEKTITTNDDRFIAINLVKSKYKIDVFEKTLQVAMPEEKKIDNQFSQAVKLDILNYKTTAAGLQDNAKYKELNNEYFDYKAPEKVEEPAGSGNIVGVRSGSLFIKEEIIKKYQLKLKNQIAAIKRQGLTFPKELNSSLESILVKRNNKKSFKSHFEAQAYMYLLDEAQAFLTEIEKSTGTKVEKENKLKTLDNKINQCIARISDTQSLLDNEKFDLTYTNKNTSWKARLPGIDKWLPYDQKIDYNTNYLTTGGFEHIDSTNPFSLDPNSKTKGDEIAKNLKTLTQTDKHHLVNKTCLAHFVNFFLTENGTAINRKILNGYDKNADGSDLLDASGNKTTGLINIPNILGALAETLVLNNINESLSKNILYKDNVNSEILEENGSTVPNGTYFEKMLTQWQKRNENIGDKTRDSVIATLTTNKTDYHIKNIDTNYQFCLYAIDKANSLFTILKELKKTHINFNDYIDSLEFDMNEKVNDILDEIFINKRVTPWQYRDLKTNPITEEQMNELNDKLLKLEDRLNKTESDLENFHSTPSNKDLIYKKKKADLLLKIEELYKQYKISGSTNGPHSTKTKQLKKETEELIYEYNFISKQANPAITATSSDPKIDPIINDFKNGKVTDIPTINNFIELYATLNPGGAAAPTGVAKDKIFEDFRRKFHYDQAIINNDTLEILAKKFHHLSTKNDNINQKSLKNYTLLRKTFNLIREGILENEALSKAVNLDDIYGDFFDVTAVASTGYNDITEETYNILETSIIDKLYKEIIDNNFIQNKLKLNLIGDFNAAKEKFQKSLNIIQKIKSLDPDKVSKLKVLLNEWTKQKELADTTPTTISDLSTSIASGGRIKGAFDANKTNFDTTKKDCENSITNCNTTITNINSHQSNAETNLSNLTAINSSINIVELKNTNEGMKNITNAIINACNLSITLKSEIEAKNTIDINQCAIKKYKEIIDALKPAFEDAGADTNLAKIAENASITNIKNAFTTAKGAIEGITTATLADFTTANSAITVFQAAFNTFATHVNTTNANKLTNFQTSIATLATAGTLSATNVTSANSLSNDFNVNSNNNINEAVKAIGEMNSIINSCVDYSKTIETFDKAKKDLKEAEDKLKAINAAPAAADKIKKEIIKECPLLKADDLNDLDVIKGVFDIQSVADLVKGDKTEILLNTVSGATEITLKKEDLLLTPEPKNYTLGSTEHTLYNALSENKNEILNFIRENCDKTKTPALSISYDKLRELYACFDYLEEEIETLSKKIDAKEIKDKKDILNRTELFIKGKFKILEDAMSASKKAFDLATNSFTIDKELEEYIANFTKTSRSNIVLEKNIEKHIALDKAKKENFLNEIVTNTTSGIGEYVYNNCPNFYNQLKDFSDDTDKTAEEKKQLSIALQKIFFDKSEKLSTITEEYYGFLLIEKLQEEEQKTFIDYLIRDRLGFTPNKEEQESITKIKDDVYKTFDFDIEEELKEIHKHLFSKANNLIDLGREFKEPHIPDDLTKLQDEIKTFTDIEEESLKLFYKINTMISDFTTKIEEEKVKNPENEDNFKDIFNDEFQDFFKEIISKIKDEASLNIAKEELENLIDKRLEETKKIPEEEKTDEEKVDHDKKDEEKDKKNTEDNKKERKKQPKFSTQKNSKNEDNQEEEEEKGFFEKTIDTIFNVLKFIVAILSLGILWNTFFGDKKEKKSEKIEYKGGSSESIGTTKGKGKGKGKDAPQKGNDGPSSPTTKKYNGQVTYPPGGKIINHEVGVDAKAKERESSSLGT